MDLPPIVHPVWWTKYSLWRIAGHEVCRVNSWIESAADRHIKKVEREQVPPLRTLATVAQSQV